MKKRGATQRPPSLCYTGQVSHFLRSRQTNHICTGARGMQTSQPIVYSNIMANRPAAPITVPPAYDARSASKTEGFAKPFMLFLCARIPPHRGTCNGSIAVQTRRPQGVIRDMLYSRFADKIALVRMTSARRPAEVNTGFHFSGSRAQQLERHSRCLYHAFRPKKFCANRAKRYHA